MVLRTLSLLLASLAGSALLGCSEEGPTVPAGSAASIADSGEPADSRTNLILIVVDTLRADHLSHYGYARDTASPLDEFQGRSTRFSQAYATAPWTSPSTTSILTGLSSLRHGVHQHGDALPLEAETLAEMLSEAGYTTHGISFNHNVSSKTGFDQGFDVLDDFLGAATSYPDIQLMRKRAKAWLDTKPKEPFFLYLHPMSVHGPYVVPKSRRSELLGHEPSRAFEYYGADLMNPLMRKQKLELREQVTPEIRESAVDQYDVAVHYSLQEIAKMLADVEAAGLMDRTSVILTADHGEELFDHGGFSHGYTLHREVLHVPLYVHRPGQSTAATDDRLVSTLDIVPTALALTGVDAPEELDGIDLLAPDSGSPDERVLFQKTAWESRAVGLSLITGSDHLIDLESAYDSPEPRLALFDLAQDPGELNDLARENAGGAARLRQTLRDEAERLAEVTPLSEPENVLDELDVEQLRALGYVE